jgi:hypothetical protein
MKINNFGLFESVFSSAHICFSVAVDKVQNHKKAYLSLKINFFFKVFSPDFRIPCALTLNWD